MLINIILALRYQIRIMQCEYTRLFADSAIALCQDDDLVTWDIIFFKGFADDGLRSAVGIVVSGIPLITVNISCSRFAYILASDTHRVETFIVCRFQYGQRLADQRQHPTKSPTYCSA